MADNQKLTTDVPVWIQCNQAPTATTAISCTCTQDDGNNRYMYYIVGALFYRYDTQGDVWQQLASPNVTPTVLATMRYTGNRGYHCRVLAATSTSVRIGGLRGRTFEGHEIRLERGTGLSQSRVLTYESETIHDAGVVTAVTTLALGDATKKWKYNQWAGYVVGITFGTNATQYKKVLYNDTNNLYIADTNLQPHDPWNNQAFQANAPYALPVITAGSQAHYQIISQNYTVSAWTATPDLTTFATVLTGGIYLMTPSNLQYYDIAHDQWQTKTLPASVFTSALATDATMERLSRSGTPLASGTVTTASGRTVSDTSKSFSDFQFSTNCRILFTSGPGAGQHRRIVGTRGAMIRFNRDLDVAVSGTTTYEIWADYDKIFVGGNATAVLNAYSPENDCWTTGQYFDDGVVANMSVALNGWMPFGITTGTRQVTGINLLSGTPTAGGTGYSKGDVLTITTGGTGGKAIVETIAPGGAVLTVSLMAMGTGYTTGTGKVTSGGTGTGCTLNILSVATMCRITTATNHNYKIGDVVAVKGCSSAGYNTSFTILGIDALNVLDVETTEAANMAASNSQSTTVLVDASKNWIVNEHAGRLVNLQIAGTAPTSQIRWIISNTATTLTLNTIVAGVNGTSKYVIYDAKTYGSDDLYKDATNGNRGFATSGTVTTLVDASKNWIPNQWAGYKMKIEGGIGYGTGIITIISNTETTLTFASIGVSADALTQYEIHDSWGLLTAGTTTLLTESSTKNWPVNFWGGKRVRIIGGTGAGQESAITSNTANALTIAAITAPDTTTVYAIQGIPIRGAGIELMWAWGSSKDRGRYMYFPRGNTSNTIDIYDLYRDRWLYGYFISPQQELFTAGSMYCYDGEDTIFMHRDATGRIFAYDIAKNDVNGGYQLYDLHGAALIGNRMEIVDAPGGEASYLYMMQHTGTKMWRVKLNVS